MTDLAITVTGVCVAYDLHALLLTGEGASDVAQRSKWEIVARGEITLALGVALFDRPFLFTPTRIVTERNQLIEGERVFDWLAERGYAMPRSEVFGLNVRGREAQVFARDIDLEASPIAICNYGNWVIALIELDPAVPDTCPTNPQGMRSAGQSLLLDRPDLPARFRRALKVYRAGPGADLTQWV